MNIDINKMIDDAILALSSDRVMDGVGELMELAIVWARAGMKQSSFNDLRQYIIQEASERTDRLFIQEKIRMAEKALRESRDARPITKH